MAVSSASPIVVDPDGLCPSFSASSGSSRRRRGGPRDPARSGGIAVFGSSKACAMRKLSNHRASETRDTQAVEWRLEKDADAREVNAGLASKTTRTARASGRVRGPFARWRLAFRTDAWSRLHCAIRSERSSSGCQHTHETCRTSRSEPAVPAARTGLSAGSAGAGTCGSERSCRCRASPAQSGSMGEDAPAGRQTVRARTKDGSETLAPRMKRRSYFRSTICARIGSRTASSAF